MLESKYSGFTINGSSVAELLAPVKAAYANASHPADRFRHVSELLGFIKHVAVPVAELCNRNTTHVTEWHHEAGLYGSGCGRLSTNLFRTLYPLLLFFCIFGNAYNLMVYRLKCFKGSAAVHLLRLKAVANLGFVVSPVLEMLHAHSLYRDSGGRVGAVGLEWLYWSSQPYAAALANFFGTASTWSTLLVTIQTLVCIVFPLSFRQISTSRNMGMGCGLVLVLSALLSLSYPLLRSVSVRTEGLPDYRGPFPGGECVQIMVMGTALGKSSAVLEKANFWTHAVLAILLPILAMLVCTGLVKTAFPIDGLGEGFTQRRKVVLKITLATTLAHLILEGPAVVTVVFGALGGSAISAHSSLFCYASVGTNYLALLNATIPFFMYMAINHHFRWMSLCVLRYLLPDFCFPPNISMSGSGLGLQQTMDQSQARHLRAQIRRATLSFSEFHNTLRKGKGKKSKKESNGLARPPLQVFSDCGPQPTDKERDRDNNNLRPDKKRSLHASFASPPSVSFFSTNEDETTPDVSEYEKFLTRLASSESLRSGSTASGVGLGRSLAGRSPYPDLLLAAQPQGLHGQPQGEPLTHGPHGPLPSTLVRLPGTHVTPPSPPLGQSEPLKARPPTLDKSIA